MMNHFNRSTILIKFYKIKIVTDKLFRLLYENNKEFSKKYSKK